MEVFKLSKPVTYGGAEYSELTLDFEKLTGAACIEAQAMISNMGGAMLMAETDKRYLSYLAARAAGVDRAVMGELSAKDFAAITTAVSNFLLV